MPDNIEKVGTTVTEMPVFSLSVSPDGTFNGSATGSVQSLAPLVGKFSAINWAALFQAVIAAMPAILAIIAAFTGQTPPPAAAPHEIH